MVLFSVDALSDRSRDVMERSKSDQVEVAKQ